MPDLAINENGDPIAAFDRFIAKHVPASLRGHFGDDETNDAERVRRAIRGQVLVTGADLDAVLVGAIVLSDTGTIACRFDHTLGVVFGDDRPFPWTVLARPARVIWRPESTHA